MDPNKPSLFEKSSPTQKLLEAATVMASLEFSPPSQDDGPAAAPPPPSVAAALSTTTTTTTYHREESLPPPSSLASWQQPPPSEGRHQRPSFAAFAAEAEDHTSEGEEDVIIPPPLRRGDLVRISDLGRRTEKRLRDRDRDALGRVASVMDDNGMKTYTVEWILGGSSTNLQRPWLVHTTAVKEGLIEDIMAPSALASTMDDIHAAAASAPRAPSRRTKRKPTTLGSEKGEQAVAIAPKKKRTKNVMLPTAANAKKKKVPATSGAPKSNAKTTPAAASGSKANANNKAPAIKSGTTTAKGKAVKRKSPASTTASQSGTSSKTGSMASAVALSSSTTGKKRPRAQPEGGTHPAAAAAAAMPGSSGGMDLYEKHRREFDRILTRLEKVDKFGWFWDEAQEENVEVYDGDSDAAQTAAAGKGIKKLDFPERAPYNFEMIRRRQAHGRYVLRRLEQQKAEYEALMQPYHEWQKRKGASSADNIPKRQPSMDPSRILHPQGVHWDLFRQDVLDMIRATEERHRENEGTSAADNPEEDGEAGAPRGSLAAAANKLRDAVRQVCERTGERHAREMRSADDRHWFTRALERSENAEAAMQSWRQQPFPERRYERLSADVLSAGLSEVDERIASFELRTSLRDSFVGLSYRYDDTGQSEAWMKSVVAEETAHKEKSSSSSQDEQSRQAALAMQADDGVIRAQVATTMQNLLIGVQDRVMTDLGVLRQNELKSANWLAAAESKLADFKQAAESNRDDAELLASFSTAAATSVTSMPPRESQPVLETETVASSTMAMEMDAEPHAATVTPTEVKPSVDPSSMKYDQNEKASSPASQADPAAAPMSIPMKTEGSDDVSPYALGETVSHPEETTSVAPKFEVPREAPESREASVNGEPEVVEQPVWGIDCYTRRNISMCLESEFDPETALTFIEKWLLPAINACPADIAHDISNAARILEGLPFQSPETEETGKSKEGEDTAAQSCVWSHTILGNALVEKIRSSAPPWLHAAAQVLRRARLALGPDFFRVHPKGHGSVVLTKSVKPNTLVTFYRGEIYPSWRWGEKMDAIDITQQRKGLKPALPDFYNMALERPQADPRGYGLLFVDASRKAGHGSSISHSCEPTCEVRVAALNGGLCLVMTTLRELEMGEELTFNYNAATDSLDEYRSAICLCGYGACRGSFLHFATAECYQQVLNRNAPMAVRFSNLIKGSTKQVMSEEDNRVLCNHGFNTASFGPISVNRHKSIGPRETLALSDSMDNIPIWLRTHVADTLRYIEYERRALPIALICNNLAKIKEKVQRSSSALSGNLPTKAEDGLTYFMRTEPEFIDSLLKQQGLIAKGVHVDGARKKAASAHWKGLNEEQKQRWKSKAAADFEKRKKQWKAQQAKTKKDSRTASKKKSANKARQEMRDLLRTADIEFQDADAEGMAAMEQRIQQLTQTLSRVGRILDRHREACLQDGSQAGNEAEGDSSVLRNLAHAPLKILPDHDVVNFMWNNDEGIVSKLLDAVKNAKCTRPSLHQDLTKIKDKYSELDAFAEDCSDLPPLDGVHGRTLLGKALLEFRTVLLEEIDDMGKLFRRYRSLIAQERQQAQGKSKPNDEDIVAGGPGGEDFDSNQRPGAAPLISSAASSATGPNDTATTSGGDNLASIPEQGEYGEDGEAERKDPSLSSNNDCATVTEGSVVNNAARRDDRCSEAVSEPTKSNEGVGKNGVDKKEPRTSEDFLQEHPHVARYSERFTLQASADLLLMNARTSNFFVMQPYSCLASTPIEVYARELGNKVPRSKVDEDVASVTDAVSISEAKTKPGKASAKNPELCSPDDIVANVSVSYQGDYVLSQLLQWYNGGMGTRPGLPNLFGCVLLPSITGCWSSDFLKKKVRADKKTFYDTKVRPRLIEWLQDPYQRGDPWPDDIQQAFVGNQADLLSSGDTSQLTLSFGSPILDFLVTGDESNILALQDELDVDNKFDAQEDGNDLLSSVDRGRPAQAVCRWVQCENPDCLKWRKIPWHVDIDLLPEQFFCKDNAWNPSVASCDAPGDDWDGNDRLVDNSGKVESPIKPKREEPANPATPSSFLVGTRFDVLRKKKFVVAKVTHIDFSGKMKRIKFHFNGTSAECDEWINFGSPRIKRLHSRTKTQPPKLKLQLKAKKGSKPIEDDTTIEVPKEAVVAEDEDLSSKDTFAVGKRFDVLRKVKGGRQRFTVGTVVDTDFLGDDFFPMSMKFHFQKTTPDHDEWIPLGSDRIAPLGSKTADPDYLASLPQGIGEKGRKKRSGEDNGDRNSIDPSLFRIGRRFDVMRKIKGRRDKKSIGVVIRVDTSGEENRVRLHYLNTSSNKDEWVPMASSRILGQREEDYTFSGGDFEVEEGTDDTNNGNREVDGQSGSSVPSFQVGFRFDVKRGDDNISIGTVEETDFSGEAKRVRFSFEDGETEWIELGSCRITRYRSKTKRKAKPKPEKDGKLKDMKQLKSGKRKAELMSADALIQSGQNPSVQVGAFSPQIRNHSQAERSPVSLLQNGTETFSSLSGAVPNRPLQQPLGVNTGLPPSAPQGGVAPSMFTNQNGSVAQSVPSNASILEGFGQGSASLPMDMSRPHAQMQSNGLSSGYFQSHQNNAMRANHPSALSSTEQPRAQSSNIDPLMLLASISNAQNQVDNPPASNARLPDYRAQVSAANGPGLVDPFQAHQLHQSAAASAIARLQQGNLQPSVLQSHHPQQAVAPSSQLASLLSRLPGSFLNPQHHPSRHPGGPGYR